MKAKKEEQKKQKAREREEKGRESSYFKQKTVDVLAPNKDY